MKTKSEIISQLFRQNWNMQGLFLSVVLLVALIITRNPIVGYAFFLIAFSTMDAIGFPALTQTRDEDVSIGRFTYRIVENTFMALILVIVRQNCGWWPVFGSILAWWMVVSDRIFYILVGSSFVKMSNDTFPWLSSWSTFLILSKFGVKPTTRSFNTVAIIGLILGAIVSVME